MLTILTAMQWWVGAILVNKWYYYYCYYLEEISSF